MMSLHRLSKIEKGFFVNELIGTVNNHVLMSYRLDTDVQPSLLKRALELLIDETPQFHSVIVHKESEFYWDTKDEYHYPIEIVCGDDNDNQHIREFIHVPFDLQKDFPCRFRLIQEDNHFLLLLLFHHITIDGVSVKPLLRRLSQLYNLLAEGKMPERLESNIFEYVRVEDELYGRENVQADIDYWNDYVAQGETDQSAPAFPHQLIAGDITKHRFVFGSLQNDIATFCKNHSVAPFRLLAAAWAVTNLKVTQASGIYLNYAVDIRPQEFRQTTGVFINDLLLYVHTGATQLFSEVIERIARDRRLARPHQYVSLADTNAGQMVRDRYGHVIFNYPLGLEDMNLQFGGKTFPLYERPLIYLPNSVQLDVEQDFNYGFVYTVADYPSFYAKMLAEAFLTVLGQVVKNDKIRTDDIVLTPQTVLSQPEVHQVMTMQNPLVDLFHRMVRLHADEVAFIFKGEKLTYSQLDQWSDAVASLIQKKTKGKKTSEFIGVHIHRSVYTVAVFLGVWKAGYAYVPIDIKTSPERIKFIVSDSSLSLLVSDVEQLSVNADTIYVNRELIEQGTDGIPACQSSRYAYMIYTSGTTGTPKGTPITQRSLVNLIEARQDYIPPTENKVELCFASISFDASVWDMFPALFTGTTLCMASEKERRDPDWLLRLLNREKITCACIPPAILTYIPYQVIPSLHYLVVAGESCPMETIQRWRQSCTVINAYGPTENTVCATMHVYTDDDFAVNIGRPLKNVSCYVLDSQRHLVPVGVRGELYIGGEQITDGYHNKPEYNREKFFVNPFATEQEKAQGVNGCIYASGDMVYRMPDGNLVFCGRSDFQVKIRGHRVELNEIVCCLERFADVKMAAVTVTQRNQRKQIMAFIQTCSQSLDQAALKAFLENELPSYMLPSTYLLVSEMPMTINGKIDMKALMRMAEDKNAPANLPTAADKKSFSELIEESASPYKAYFRGLGEIWQELLGDKVSFGLHDKFFELGGDSIAIILMSQAIGHRFGINVRVSDVYKASTIEQLAELIDHQSHDAVSSEETQLPDDPQPTEPVEEPLPPHLQSLLMECMMSDECSKAYHLFLYIPFEQGIDEEKAMQAWNIMMQRQEALRMTFSMNAEGRPTMMLMPFQPLKCFPVVGFADEEQLRTLVKEQLDSSYSFNGSPMCYPVLYRNDTTGQFLLTIYIHHLITDGWSLQLFRKQYVSVYQALLEGRADEATSLPVQHYAAYLQSKANSVQDSEAADYWSRYLHDFEDLRLPYKRATDSDSRQSQVYMSQLRQNQVQRIQDYCERHHLTHFSFFVSAYMLVLARICRQTGFVVGYPSAGRTDSRYADVIGYFVHPLPLRFKEEAWACSFADFCRSVFDDVRSSEQHLMAFSQLVEIASQQGTTDVNSPLVQTLFTMNDASPELELIVGRYAQFPLTFSIECHPSADWRCVWEYAVARFEPETIQLMSRCFEVLIDNILNDESALVSGLTMVTAAEREAVIRNNTIYPLQTPRKNLVDLFCEQVAANRHPWVMKDKAVTMTYQEVDADSDKIAEALLALVPHHSATGIFMNRSCRAVVAMLGILKAGHMYVPLDKSYPAERIRTMVEDSGMRCIVCNQELRGELQQLGLSSAVSIVVYEDCMKNSAARTHCPEPITADTPAYMIYTSGTTGKPKGVVITHGNAASFVLIGTHPRLLPSPDDIVLQYCSYLFDVSVNDIFTTILNGARLVCIGEEERHDPDLLFALLEREKISHAYIAPAFLLACNHDAPATLKTLIVGGETPSQVIVDRYTPHLTMINGYGPTENTVFSTTHYYNKEGIMASNCIGKPLPGVSSYVLDSHLNMVPPGCPGQLFLGGLQVSPGYHQRPELNEERFIPNPFVSPQDAAVRQNLCIYATGDIVTQDASGNIFYQGRKDFQVKVRGFRIELSEIEQALLQYPSVSQCIVDVRTIGTTQQLVAFVGSQRSDLSAAELHRYLSTLLPPYMLPAYWSIVSALPVNSNGKINRRQLPEPEHYAANQHHTECAMNEKESQLCAVVAQVMNIDASVVHPDDDLFDDLGVTSIHVLQIAHALKEAGQVLSPSDIFRSRNIRRLAKFRQSQSVTWYEGYDAAKPVVVLVCGYTAAHPFYSDYLSLLRRHFSVLVFDTFSFWNEGQTDATAYIDYLTSKTKQAVAELGTRVYAVTGHSIGSELGMLLAERLRLSGHPDIHMVAIGTSLHVNQELLQLLPAEDQPLRQMQQTMPPLTFQGQLSVVLESQPSSSLTLNGPSRSEYTTSSERFLKQNLEAWQREYPQARIIQLDADHFSLLQPQHLPTILDLF